MTRSKVAAKYINLVDRVPAVDPRTTLVPAYTVIQKVGQDIDLAVFSVTDWPEWDESTLSDLVASGLRGQ